MWEVFFHSLSAFEQGTNPLTGPQGLFLCTLTPLVTNYAKQILFFYYCTVCTVKKISNNNHDKSEFQDHLIIFDISSQDQTNIHLTELRKVQIYSSRPLNGNMKDNEGQSREMDREEKDSMGET